MSSLLHKGATGSIPKAKGAKAILDNETCIILMDFLENYSFLVQDAIQSFYWQNQQGINFISLQFTTVMMMVNLNMAVIVSYQIIKCMNKLQFTVLFH